MNGRKEKRTFLLAMIIIGILAIVGCNSAGSGDDTAVGIPGASAVDLGTAGDFVILAKTAITTTGVTAITGDIGLSPAAASLYDGFGQILDVATGKFSKSDPPTLVTGKMYASDYATPTPADMTAAISDMQTAYTNAAGRTDPDFTELGAGEIGGLTLAPGLYKWGTPVNIATATTVTLDGSSTDYWIFQIGDTLNLATNAQVTLTGGALVENIYWQVSSGATLEVGSQFMGILMAKTAITLKDGATVNGRLFAQSAVTLIGNTITPVTP